MDKLFLTILNMSLTGAFVIVVVILVRFLLKKAPKFISYCLWAVVGFRLICPYAVEGVFSLIPFRANPVSENILVTDADVGFTGAVLDSMRSPFDETIIHLNPDKTDMESNQYYEGQTTRYLFGYEAQFILASYIYPIGFIIMFVYGIFSYILLKRRMRVAIRVGGNLYETDNIQSPFVLGIIKPKIYLPLSLTAGEREYIVLHERTHIRRHDHIVKFAAYFILCLHWFNPLAWAAFLLMGVDMEMSCDERVLKEMGGETKHDYSRSLLLLATQRRVIGGSPLAFGEGGVKERVKNVLNFKKPSRMIIVAAVALVAVLSIGFAVNRASDKNNFNVPYFSAGDLTLGYYIEDMDLSIWSQANTSEWDYTGQYGAFRINDEGRIDKFTVYVHAFTAGIWTMSGIEPTDWVVHNYVFHIPANIDEVLERFGEGSERYDAPEKSKDVLSYVRYEDKHAGIAVLVEFHKGNGQIAYVTAEGLPAAASRPTPVPISTAYKPRKWLDYYNPRGDELIPYDETLELELPEFPETMFYWTAYEVRAVDANGSRVLFGGYPIWNVFLADVTDDGLPELCATVSMGFGIIDDHVIVYDYANDKLHRLTDRMVYDYSFSLENGLLTVKQKEYDGGEIGKGYFAMTDGELIVVGIDRTKLESQETTPSGETPSPTQIVRQELINDGCKIEYVFLMSVGGRKTLDGVDNGELATVYASYTEGEYGDAIYCMRYDFERASTDSPWTHTEPTFWDGIAVDVAAYVARTYYSEQTGAEYDGLNVTWAGTEEAERLFPDININSIAAFIIGEGDDIPSSIILTSPDGQSHWKVIGYNGDRT